MTLLASTLEAGTSGTTITTGNSGGGSNSDPAFDAVNIGSGASVTFDNTHAAHGTLAAKLTTGSTAALADLVWNTSMGTQTTVWFRAYLYFTANPSATVRLWNATATSTTCGSVSVNTSGKLIFTTGSGGATQFTFTAAIPLNAWFRVEGFLTGNASTGQVSLSLYKTMDSSSADESHTSAASLNTTGQPTTYAFGVSINVANASYWVDDVALSNVAAIGPYLVPVALADSGSAADAGTVTASVTLADSGTAADAESVTAAVTLADSGSAADAPAVTASVSLAESGTSATSLAVTAAVALADSGSAADSPAVTAMVTLGDSGSGADAPVITASVSLADLAAAADVLAVTMLAAAVPATSAPTVTGRAGAASVTGSSGSATVVPAATSAPSVTDPNDGGSVSVSAALSQPSIR